MRHIVLLGDSILDNAAYTRGEPDVATHLRNVAPDCRVTLLAVDGNTTSGIKSQSTRIPADATHLVVAVGGNDALGNSDLLDLRVRSTAEALRLFAERLAVFDRSYRAALDIVIARRLPATVCTIYNGNFDPAQAELVRVGLATFNDVVLRAAFEHALTVIDLRLVCARPGDYANPIEPSGPGGRKIALAIRRAVDAAEGQGRFARVIV
jgi:hypothetical protein